MGIVAGGALDAAAGLTVRLPQGTYKLCAVWIGGVPPDPTIDVRRRLDWDGVLEDLADSEFEWRPDITAYVDDWDDDGLGGPTGGDSLTGAMGAMGLPWWALLVMILLLICCLCCCLAYCLLLRKVRKSYQPQGKNTTTQYRRGAFRGRSTTLIVKGWGCRSKMCSLRPQDWTLSCTVFQAKMTLP